MLKQRLITGIILITLTLWVLFYVPPPVFCILTGIITLLSAWEWSHLMQMQKFLFRFLYLVLVGYLLFGALFVPISLILICAAIWWLLAMVLIILYPRGSRFWGHGFFWRGLFGIFVLLPCWAALNDIRNQGDGLYALLFVFILIWGADSSAYFIGRKWGKHPLAPRVSPGKSIEGLIGAIIFSILIACVALWLGHAPLRLYGYGIALSLVSVLFSVVGDLFESMLKREAHLKDSGQLLPGHGGLLDRIDSLTAALPIFALGTWLLARYIN